MSEQPPNLQRGADVNAADSDGLTRIYIAARDGDTASVRALAARGADVNKEKSKDDSPFFELRGMMAGA